ncbi:MAG: MFS transporter [Desulfovibrionaceae bacterium]|nr:MFS transporter [Desulfovibrionaceae bacterium]
MEASKKIFYGWFVVAGGFILMAVLHSMLQTCFSLFVVPVTTDMGITRSAFGICNTVVMVVTMLLSPYMGKWLSQKNTRLIFTACVFGLGLAYASYSLAQSSWHLYVSAALVGIFSCGAVVLPLSIIITNWFQKSRGTAISIALAGSGIGGAIISPILTYIIQTMGWRPAFVIFGIVMIVVEVPVALFLMRPKPEAMGLAPYGSEEKTQSTAATAAKPAAEQGLPLKELKKHTFFWMYWAGMFVLGLVGFGSLGQLAASLTDSYGQGFCAMIISFFLLLLTPAKISLGWVYDKIGPKLGTIYVMGFFAIALAMLLITHSTTLMWVMAIFYSIGICSGTVTPPVVTAATFGSKYYGEIYGFINFAVMAGGALGAPVVAAVYDFSGTYEAAWIACSLLCILSTILLVLADVRCKKLLGQVH